MVTYTMHLEKEYWQGIWEGVEPIRCDSRKEWPEEAWETAKARTSLILDVTRCGFYNKSFLKRLAEVLTNNKWQAIKFQADHTGVPSDCLEFLTKLAPSLPKWTQLWIG